MRSMITRIGAKARAQVSDPLMRGAYSLIANTAATSLLGVVFWIVAARLIPASDLGVDSTLIAGMMTLSGICQLNLPNSIPSSCLRRPIPLGPLFCPMSRAPGSPSSWRRDSWSSCRRW